MATSQLTKIVQLAVTLTVAPQPSQLQRSAALISVGGTTLANGAFQFFASIAALQAILSTSGNYVELTNMATDFTAQGSVAGFYVLELGAQSTPQDGIAALNTWITDNPRIFYTYTVPADWDTIPAPAASPTLASVAGGTLAAAIYYVKIAYQNVGGTVGNMSAEVSLDVAADFLLTVASPPAFGAATEYAIYVGTAPGEETLQDTLALGTDYTEPTSGLIAGTVPPLTLADMGNNFSAPVAKTYFIVSSTPDNMAAYGVQAGNSIWGGYKAIIAVAPSPTAQSGEFDAGAFAYQIASNNPGANNKLVPMSYRYLYGANPWPASGNSAAIQQIVNYGGNYVGTGAEGGIGNSCIFQGTTSSLEQISWWYGIDWLQIQIHQAIAAAVINGSNSNPPLLYDQDGINTLLEVAQAVADNAVTFGCALSAVCSAIPFYTYTQEQPSDYNSGIYSGFSCDAVGQEGFLHINFNIDAIQFA